MSSDGVDLGLTVSLIQLPSGPCYVIGILREACETMGMEWAHATAQCEAEKLPEGHSDAEFIQPNEADMGGTVLEKFTWLRWMVRMAEVPKAEAKKPSGVSGSLSESLAAFRGLSRTARKPLIAERKKPFWWDEPVEREQPGIEF